MIEVHACARAQCDQCGDRLGYPGADPHYPTETAALDAAAGQGWRVGPGGRLYCPACAPVLTCQAQGHTFTPWQAVVVCEDDLAGREYRYCQRCCLLDTRRGQALGERALIGAMSGPGTHPEVRTLRRAAVAGRGVA